MNDDLYEIDLAMNMIKEDIIKDLSESVSKQTNNAYFRDISSNNLTFFDNSMD